LVPREVLIFDNARHALLIVALTFPNGDAEADWADAGERIERILDKIRAPLPRRTVAANGRPELRSPVDEEKFRSRVAAIKEYIRAGDVIQTVFSQPFTSDQAPNPWRLYRASAFHRDALRPGRTASWWWICRRRKQGNCSTGGRTTACV
jgi:anthranilate synthase component I